jgi:hypothetical protein
MKTGTKSLLFGLHQFILHPTMVTMAWKKLYGRWPDWKEMVAIVVHDWGYWGKPNIDGDEGELHPLLGGRICDRLIGEEYGDMCVFHSGTIADKAGVKPSRLCMPDKYGSALNPVWLMALLGWLSGETRELRYAPKYQHAHRETMTDYEMYHDFQAHYLKKVADYKAKTNV